MSSTTTRVLYDLVARDRASKTFSQVGANASKLEKASVAVGSAIKKGLAVGTLALGGIGVASVKAATGFEAEMTRISTQAGGTTKDVKLLSDQVLKLGGKVQQGPKQLADSLYHLKSVGMDNASAMKALKEAADLAAVGHANLEETTNALAGAWRTGIKGATSFHEAVSTVNAIIGAGNMSMEQFNAAIGTGILPSAKTFGLSMKQVGAALALMTDEGIDSASAATRLRMSFSLLGAPSHAAEKQLGKIGLTGLQLAEAMRGKDGLIGALTLLKEHLDKSGMSAAQQSQLLSRAFGGGRSSSGILLMLNNLDVLIKKQDQINRSTGKFDDAVKQQRKTAQAQWALLISGLESLSVRLGTKILPPVTGFVSFLNSTAMPAAAKFGRTMANLVPTDKIATGFSTVKTLVGDFLGGLTGGKQPGLKLKIGAPTFSKNLPPSLIAHGLGTQAPTVPASTAPKNLPPSVIAHGLTPQTITPPPSAAKAFGTTIRNAISGGISNINWGKLGSSLGKGLATAIGWVAKHAADFTKKIADVFMHLDFVQIGKSFGASAIPLAIGFIGSLFDPLFSLDFWKKHWLDTIIAVISIIPIGKFAGGLAKVFEHIPFLKVFSPVLKGIEHFGGWIEKGLGKIFGPVGRGLKDGITKAFPEAVAAIEREAGLLTTRVGVWGLKLLEKGQKAAEGLGKGIERGVSWVTEKALGLVKAIGRPFAKAGSWLWSKGSDFVSGLTRGIADRASGIGSWIWKRTGKPAVDMFKNAGSWLWSKGRDFVAGLTRGVVDRAKGIGGWVWNRVAKPQIDMFKNAASWLVSKGRSFVSGMVSGIVDRAKGIGSWAWRTIAKPQLDMFKNAGSWLRSKGGALITGMKNGIVDKIKGIGSWIKSNIVDPVVSGVKHFFGIKSPSRVFMGIGGHLITGLLKGMTKTSPTAIAKKVFGSLPKALAGIAKKGLVSISSLPGKALKALGSLGGSLLSFLGIGGGGGGGGVDRWAGAVTSVLSMLHAPAYAVPAVLKRIQIESGGNPNAINLYDVNAQNGDPSRGLMQTIGSTFNAYAGPFRSRGIYDPIANIYAGVNYAMHRYGGNWISVMTRPGGYAKGGFAQFGETAWVGEKGAELMQVTPQGTRIFNHDDSVKIAATSGIRLPGYASGTILNAADRVRRDRRDVEDAKDALARAKRRHKGVAAAEKKLQAAEKELKAANISLANAKRSAKTSIANTIKTGLAKTLATSTSSGIASAIKSVATKLLNAGFDRLAKSVMRSGDKLEKLADRRASLEKTIAAAQSYASDQTGKINDFLSISGTSATSVGALISQMTGQQKTATDFTSLSKSLKRRGASKELIAQLAEAGPGSQLATILGARNVTTQDISKLNSLVKSGGKLATTFGQDMANLMYDSGASAGKGFLSGLKAQEKGLEKQMNALAQVLVKSIKKSLKIKSPSQLMRDEVGKQVALGMVVGMDRHRPHVAAAGRRLATTAYAATAGAHAARANHAFNQLAQLINSGQLGGSEVHIHFDDPTLKDLIRVTTKPMIEASESSQAYRAKVGRR